MREGTLRPADPGFNFMNKENQYWKCKYVKPHFTIRVSTTIIDPQTGAFLPKLGLSVGFENGRWSIERDHPDREMIEERLRISSVYKSGVLLCMDDIPESKRHLVVGSNIGEGPKQRLYALGIQSDEQRQAVIRELTDINEEENFELKTQMQQEKTRNDELAEQIKVMKSQLDKMKKGNK